MKKMLTYSNMRGLTTVKPWTWASLNRVYMYGSSLYRKLR